MARSGFPNPCLATALLAAGLVSLAAWPRAAHADVPKQACVEANASAQVLRQGGHFAAAREKLRLCGDASCPGMVRDDCARQMEELERVQPAIVFDVKDPDGNDLTAVRVRMDGQLLSSRLTGAALPVDPGEHTFVFEAEGKAPVTRKLVVIEADKGRRERVVLGGDGGAARPAPASATPEVATGEAPSDPRRALGIVIGSIGLATLGTGAVFAYLTKQAIDDQKNDCPSAAQCPNYPQARTDHSHEETYGLVATAAVLAGAAFVGVGTVLFFSGRPAAAHPESGLVVAPGFGPGSAGLTLRGGF